MESHLLPTTPAPARPLVAVVDDDELLRTLLSAQLEAAGYEVVETEDIESTLRMLSNPSLASRLDALILDRGLGEEDGLSLARRMKSQTQWKHIPIVMLTAYAKPEQTREGLDAGVFYYLNKPVQQAVLASVLARAQQEMQRQRMLHSGMRKLRAGFARMESSKFEFSTLDHVEHLACFFANCFPNPARVLNGLAELMTNAVEHGILEIGYEEKGALLEQGTWRQEITRRQQSAEHIDKRCELIFTRRSEGCYARIQSPGPGFDWRRHSVFDTQQASRLNGRGIVKAIASFDKMAFNAAGNEVSVFLGWESQITY